MLLLENKNAVITGCNRGIGKEIVKVFAENGANIWACVRKENVTFTEYINDLEQKHSVRISPVYFDLIDEKQIKAGVQTIKEVKENIDILIERIRKYINKIINDIVGFSLRRCQHGVPVIKIYTVSIRYHFHPFTV